MALCLVSCAGSSASGGQDAADPDAGDDSGAEGGEADGSAVDTGVIETDGAACTSDGEGCVSRCAADSAADALAPTAIVADGQVWAMWEARDATSSDVCAAPFDTASGELGEASELNDSPITTFARVLGASSENGTAFASWREGDGAADRLRVGKHTVSSEAWSTSAAVMPAAWLTQETSLAAGPRERAAVAWAEHAADDEVAVWASHHSADNGWSQPSELSAESYAGTPPVVAVDGEGDVLVAWARDTGAWVSRFDADTDRWLSPTELTNIVAGKLRIASRGPNTLISWVRCTAAGCAIDVARYDRANDSWQTMTLAGTADNVTAPDLVMNAQGDALLVWTQPLPSAASANADAVYAARYDAASASWTSPQQVDADAADQAGRPAAALGDDGTAHVAWVESIRAPGEHVGTPRLRVSRQSAAAADWDEAAVLAEGTQTDALTPDLLWVAQGAIVTWAQAEAANGSERVRVILRPN